MRSVVAYCRSACEPAGGPPTVRSQERAVREFAEAQGLSIAAVYTDAGVSGVTLERPALQRLIADCRGGKIDMVITNDADRLSRDKAQLFGLLHCFQTTGVRVQFSTSRGERTLLFDALMLSAMAELEKAKARSKPKE